MRPGSLALSKMAAPDDEFLVLWRGISVGLDALWKLKQRSVTQCGLFISEYKNLYGFWSDLLL